MPTQKYEWVTGCRWGGHDPNEVAKCLEKIKSNNDGSLYPQAVVDTASDPSHPMHDMFLWDNDLAGNEFRLDQARSILRSVRIIHITKGKEVSRIAYVHVTRQVEKDRPVSYYEDTETAFKSKEYRDQVLEEALRLLRGLRMRYAELKELSTVWKVIDELAVASTQKKKRA